jgi:hypothetical protein
MPEHLDELVNLDGVSPDAPIWYPDATDGLPQYRPLTSAEISTEDDGAGTYVQLG